MYMSKTELVNAIKLLELLNSYLSLFHGMPYKHFTKCLLDRTLTMPTLYMPNLITSCFVKKIGSVQYKACLVITGAIKEHLKRNLIKNLG